MEDKHKICDYLLPTLQATANLNHLTDLEYVPEQSVVVATIGAGTMHIDVSGYSGTMFVERIIDVLTGEE